MNRIIPIGLYGLGLGLFSATDILVSSYMEPQDIVSWAEMRSTIGIVGFLCLCGLDQVFVRSPQSSSRLLRRLVFQVPLLAVPVSALVHSLGYLDSYLQAFFLAIGSSGAIAIYQYYRSHHLRAMAQLTQQGWRIASFFLILLMIWQPNALPLGNSVVALLLSGVGVSAVLIRHYKPSELVPQNPEPFHQMYRIGARFLATSTFLALAVYAEQLVIQSVGTVDQAAEYFTHATYFLFPMGLLNGYLGFLLGPWVRENHDSFRNKLRHNWPLALLLTLVIAVAMNFVGLGAWKIMNPSIGNPDTSLRLIFLATSVMITAYQFPSAYNGVFAKPRHHDVLIFAQLFAIFSAAAVFLVMLNVLKLDPMLSVAIGSMTNWFLRSASGYGIISFVTLKRIT
ncbi:hypothetical protein SAMN05444000_1298 [Shimia gijangensis]|uniref:Membrane protein involved in the export of O-antigen and teichoic acid n=1 Tax=Shimia gijangensis TaxID=1470563 RepID=A0A1M6SEM0_9RHOB|nr:hypothetical protein [Shimia gijangensis]SHK43007.1 hypothetical protein SAMN05444000_1298 [Shimia gijangensis]